MKFTILINQVKAIEWGLNLQQAALFAYCYELQSWAEPLNIAGEIYYFSSKSKVISDFPILTDKPDTIYRMLKTLEEKQLIKLAKQGSRDYIRLCPRAKSWNTEKNPNSENYPGIFGKNSETTPEKNPTDKNTISDTITNDTNGVPPKSKEEKIKEEKIQFCRTVISFVKSNPSKYPKLMYLEFCRHWFELTRSGNKMRFQDEKFFEVPKRLATWFTTMNSRNPNRLKELWEAEQATKKVNELLKELL